MYLIRVLAYYGAAIACAGCGPSRSAAQDGAVDPNDRDNDGYPADSDCDDFDPTVYPGAPEICGDGVDNNCNTVIDGPSECASPCEAAAQSDSYYGCEFFAADLPQSGTTNNFGISVSNPSASLAANITLLTSAGEIDSFVVPPLEVRTYEDNSRSRNVGEAGITNNLYAIRSDIPVAAYQFNSLDTIDAASTDASLLFASHSLGTQYFAMDYDSRTSNDGFITVFATAPDTTVTITPTTAVNGPTTAMLQPFQTMTIMSKASDVSLTGSRIEADKPIGVFSGNRCTNVPRPISHCDHLEQQIFPRQAIGVRYVVGKFHARQFCDPPDIVRVMADEDGTTVSLQPPVAGPWVLDAGEWQEFEIADSVEITSSAAVLVGQYMQSNESGVGCEGEGDPTFVLQVPLEQYRRDYVFLAPETYDSDFINIVAPLGTIANLDGEPLALSTTEIGTSGYALTAIGIADGHHSLTTSAPVGLVVYGMGGPVNPNTDGMRVSYGYPAGLNLSTINVIE